MDVGVVQGAVSLALSRLMIRLWLAYRSYYPTTGSWGLAAGPDTQLGPSMCALRASPLIDWDTPHILARTLIVILL